MSENSLFPENPEEEIVNYIKSGLSAEVLSKCDDELLLDIVDLLYDYYDKHGFLDFGDFEKEIDDDDLAKEVFSALKSEDSGLSVDEVKEIIKLELDFEDSMDIF